MVGACWCSWPPATLAFGVMAVVRVQGSVKRRAANIGRVGDIDGRRHALAAAFEPARPRSACIEYTTKHYSAGNTDDTKVLRRRLIQAGIYDPRAVGAISSSAAPRWRSALAALRVLVRADAERDGSRRSGCWSGSAASSAISAPSLYLDQRIKARKRRAPAPAFRISWTCWWCAPTPASAWRRRSTASAASLATPIRRSPPTSTWPISKSAPAAP